jgi:SAM-dependent methyltransferase
MDHQTATADERADSLESSGNGASPTSHSPERPTELLSQAVRNRLDTLSAFYPEVRIAGMTSVDGTVRFYAQVNALLHPSMVVLDYGAGRAQLYEDNSCAYRRSLQTIKGKVRRVIGCDVDPALLENRSVDEHLLIRPGDAIPLPDQSVDLIVSDNTFEHIEEPAAVTAEFRRILKPGGWICARTPNKYAYTSVPTRAIPNRFHASFLKRAQPHRKLQDTFPTAFKINTISDISRYFPPSEFENHTFRASAEPSYHFNRRPVLAIMLIIHKLLPAVFTAPLFVFLRRRPVE